LSFAEITEWASKQKLNPKELLRIVSELSEIIKLDFEIAVLAGKLNFERKKTVKNWGMLDSLILATSLIYKLKVVTGDLHFKDLPNVEIL
jgi:predicted nucleic acid-binding protein